MLENHQYDKKSLSFLKGKNTVWDELQLSKILNQKEMKQIEIGFLISSFTGNNYP